jgi:hypothetical protein
MPDDGELGIDAWPVDRLRPHPEDTSHSASESGQRNDGLNLNQKFWVCQT